MADDVDQADASKGTQERTDPATAKPAKKAAVKKTAAKRTQAGAKKAGAKKAGAKKAASSKVDSDEGGTGPKGRLLPVDKSGLHSVTHDALNPAFAPVQD